MKKLLLFLTLNLLGIIGAFAQSTLVGTLSHDGEVTVFYGAEALIKAHEAAEPGDIITLSSGSFTGLTITKAVTIRGAGMFPEDNGTIITNMTTSSSNLSIDIEPSSSHLNLEGLYFSCNVYVYGAESPTFNKCQFGRSFSRQTSAISRAYTSPTYINCFFIGEPTLYCDDYSTFIACYFDSKLSYGSKSSYTFTNCILNNTNSISDNCVVNNSIIFAKVIGGYISIRSGAVIKSSKVCSEEGDCLKYCTSIDTEVLPFETECFQEGTRYELKDELVRTWLGDDGTQVGIYGGPIPFDPTPTNPQITKFNVANKTSADGKLSVDIEVSAAQ